MYHSNKQWENNQGTCVYAHIKNGKIDMMHITLLEYESEIY